MSSPTETGYARLVSSFENFVQHCQQLGTTYNPPQVRLQMTSLSTALTNARNALLLVSNTFNEYKFATNARETGINQMQKLALRIVSVLEATDAPRQTLNDAHYYLMKIQGRRAKPKAISTARIEAPSPAPAPAPGSTPATEAPGRSAAQTGVDALIEHFTRLVLIATTEPAYASSEPDLQSAALNATVTQLQALNTAAINAQAAWHNAIVQRNTVLNDALTGIINVTRQAKKYVRSVLGSTNLQYKRLRAIRVY